MCPIYTTDSTTKFTAAQNHGVAASFFLLAPATTTIISPHNNSGLPRPLVDAGITMRHVNTSRLGGKKPSVKEGAK